jgi:hypothetical protein
VVAQLSRIVIEHQCPQCGAPVILEETDRLFTCTYCKVKSFLFTPDFFRYVLPFQRVEKRTPIFFPYWRFKGSLFSSLPNGISHRILDVSHQAVSSKFFPASLGVRSQAMKLKFLSSDTEGTFIRPALSFKDLLDTVEKRVNTSMPKPIFCQSFTGDTLSQIYAPFYVDERVHDAVLNRPISPQLPEDFKLSSLSGEKPDWRIQFIPAQCPHCGWDLDGERDSLALSCKNCDSVWMQSRKGFTGMTFGCLPGNDGPGEVIELPFYRIEVKVSGIELDSYADLVKVANLPKVSLEAWKDRPFFFWCPAFKIRPQDFLRFSSTVTLSQPTDDLVPKLPVNETYPVTLSIQEAEESLKINLASFIKPASLLPRLQEIEIQPKSCTLVYVPFRKKGSEIFQPSFQLCITNNLLNYARYL